MAAGLQHVIAVPLDVAARRMPAALVAGSADVWVERLDASSPQWVWRSSSGGGRLALSSVGAATTGLTVTPDAETAATFTHVLTVELLGALQRTWAPTVPPAAASPGRRRARIAAAVAAVVIPALAVAGAQVLAPPAPMDVAAAVAQFRSDTGPGVVAAPTDRASEMTSRGTSGRGAAPTGTTPRGRQSAEPAGQERAPARRTAPRAMAPAETAAPASTRPSDSKRQRSNATAPARSQPEARRPAAPARPQEGVYRYATQGHQSIDQPSSRHDYPSETAMTIRHNDCGFVAHWQPLENRWDEMTVCRSNAGSFIPTMATHREFYGQEKDSRYTCSKGFYAYRPQPGATWTGRCTDDESQMQIQGRTLGREAMRVGDQTVEAVHYVIEARITGGNEGTWRAERWIDPKSGLLLRAQANTDATSKSSFGTVRYHEETDVRLLSMTPER